MGIFRVLHLSDIHIGSTYIRSTELADKIANDIAQNGLTGIQCVLVTGDIFNGPSGDSSELIEEAANFFRTLMQQINCDQPKHALLPDDFVFVPGNHDLVWTDRESARWDKYRAFLTAFYGTIPARYDQNDFSTMRAYNDDKIVFLGFNSCGLEKSRPHSDICTFFETIPSTEYQRGGIDKAALLDLLDHSNTEQFEDYGDIPTRQFANQRRRMAELDGYTAVALFHHHFYLLPDIAGKVGDTDVVRNHAALVRDLRSMGVKTVLHGHKHFDLERPFINEDYYDTTESIIDVFAGGSVGSGGLQRHTFSILDFYPKQESIRILQSKFIYNEDHLEPIRRKQIPPLSSAPQVVKLLDLLQTNIPGAYQDYQNAAMTNNRLYNACKTIVEWVGGALTGFPEVLRYLSEDPLTLLFLLFSIHSRTLYFVCKHSSEDRNRYDAYQSAFRSFFDKHLMGHVPSGYERLFQAPKLYDAATLCDGMLDRTQERRKKQYLAFSMVGIFFSDLYLVMTEYADDFYKQISHKVNIKLEPNCFHKNVPGARIVLTSDADRRSAYVSLLCNDATAHKLAVLFVKEFDLTISKYEDYFKLIGLKLYYLLPKIEKDPNLDALDNYNFEAYIPTLLPLLTGDNIYHSKEVFARELIQNSIDAISVREAVEGALPTEDRTVYIELGTDGNGKKYFQITDHGTGMDRYKIERYFTSIGRSFYSGEDYAELGISYKPISSFGIGFLSSFMVCQEIDVQTRSFEGEREGLKLHIPNYEGCFFIERDVQAETGTRIRLYLTNATDHNKIIKYIESVMKDISYPIQITRKGARPRLIPAHSARQGIKDRKHLFFVPFQPDGLVDTLDWRPGLDTTSYPYGLSICAAKGEQGQFNTLNAGILVGDDSPNDLFSRISSKSTDLFNMGFSTQWYDITTNFPANWIQMDVSREKVVGFSPWLREQNGKLGIRAALIAKIAEALQPQVEAYLNYAREQEDSLPAASAAELLQLVSLFAESHVPAQRQWADERAYSVSVLIDQEQIEFSLLHHSKSENHIEFKHGVKKKELISQLQALIFKSSAQQEIISTKNVDIKPDFSFYHQVHLRPKLLHGLTSSPILLYPNSKETLSIEQLSVLLGTSILSLYMNNRLQPKKAEREQALSYICNLLLRHFSVSQAERGDAHLVVSYDTIKSCLQH